jgi:hypothetical protein
MKYIKLAAAIAASLCSSVASSQAELVLDYASTAGSTITFQGNGSKANSGLNGGGTFSFSSGGSGADFTITSTSDGSGLGDTGVINGSYKIGAIATGVGGLGHQSAPVTDLGGNTITITDNLGKVLTADVNWESISTYQGNGSVNSGAVINLTDVSYSGTQAALLAILDEPSYDTLSFNFTPAKTLIQLSDGGTTGGPFSTSFNGVIDPIVPEPTTLISGAMLLMPFGASTLRMLRKNREVQ